MTTIRSAEGRGSGGFSYFMIRLSPGSGESAGEVAGVVERLGTGEKCAFGSGRELVELMSAWPAAPWPVASDFETGAGASVTRRGAAS